MTKKLIYIADDEVNICNIIKSFLMKEGFDATAFHDGLSLMDAFRTKPADMLIIDVMMPEMDGFSICTAIRRESDVPIIIVSAKDTEPDKIAGLTLGSDDYLTKPFSPMELMARIKSIFRRMERGTVNEGFKRIVHIADVTLNPDMKEARCSGHSIGLTGMEFSLLQYLSEHRERAVGRGELLDKVWGFEHEVETRATDDMIKRVRRKLSDAGSVLKIDTVWGFGFKIGAGD